MAKTAQQAASKWATNLSGATQSITEGVAGVTVSPGQLAARQADVWAQNTAAAKSKFAARSAAVSAEAWKQAMTEKGIPRIQQGASSGQPKMEAFMGRLLPYINSQRQQLPPRGNLQQNIARATAWINAMAKFGG